MKSKKFFKKADLILIAVVIAAAGILLFILYGLNTGSGSYVQIEINGKAVQSLPLDTNCSFDIESADGGRNTLVIEDGSAKMTDANCPDGICTNHKSINKTGESIICLPHKVVVTVTDKNTSQNEIDAVA